MVALADDDGVKILPDQGFDSAMGVMHKGTGRFQHTQPALLERLQGLLRRAVGGDHDRRRDHVPDPVFDADAAGAQSGQHRFVMHQIAQNGQGRGAVLRVGQGNGVAHPETHAQMGGPNDAEGAFR